MKWIKWILLNMDELALWWLERRGWLVYSSIETIEHEFCNGCELMDVF